MISGTAPPHEVRYRGGHRGTEVRAELLRSDGDEDGPVARHEAEVPRQEVERRRGEAAHREVGGDAGERPEDEEENDLLTASPDLAEDAGCEAPQRDAAVAEGHGGPRGHGSVTPTFGANSGAEVMRIATTNQVGRPMRMQRR